MGLTENLASILTSALGTRAARFSVLRAGRTSTPRKFLGTHFCWRLSGHRDTEYGQKEWIPTGNRTRKLPSCGAVPQPAVLPLEIIEVPIENRVEWIKKWVTCKLSVETHTRIRARKKNISVCHMRVSAQWNNYTRNVCNISVYVWTNVNDILLPVWTRSQTSWALQQQRHHFRPIKQTNAHF